jgi:hypothetical protein
MKKTIFKTILMLVLAFCCLPLLAQQRRPIDNEHPLWLVHIDVWYTADPQKIIDLIPDDVKPYVCMNLSLSCQYDKEKNVYKMPQQAVRTYKSWASVCQKNGMWFTCQPASGGHTHIQDDDLETFEYFFKHYPNFLGWNYAEQFWGFDEAGDKSSSTQEARWALFAKLVEMSHQYGGFLTVSFCGNIWSHALNPLGEMKRNKDLLEACRKYPEAILWLYKYTTSSCFYNNESVTFSPFISGLAKNYGVRYDNCGWNGATEAIVGADKCKYPASAGIGTVMEQTGINGGAVWDGPELTWREECFHEVNTTTEDGYRRRNWARFPNFNGVWLDMFRKVIDGTIRIPSRREVVERTKIVVINDVSTGNDEQKYAAWGNLYDGLYKQDDPFNRGNGQWMDNFCYLKKTGRYPTIPVALELADELAQSIPLQVKKSNYTQRWPNVAKKVEDFDQYYPEASTGDLFVARMGNQLVTYTPYTYLNNKTTAEATIPLKYNTCETLQLRYGKLSSGVIREYPDHLDFYLNNFRTDSTAMVKDVITVTGATEQPTYTLEKRNNAQCRPSESWDQDSHTYTLTVNHMGPVDISLQCAGNMSRDEVPPAATPLQLPQQPEAFHGAIVIEAEDMDYKDIKNCSLSPYNQYPSEIGHSGNGFVDMGTKKSGSLRHRLSLTQGGWYRIAVRYTGESAGGHLTMSVNGEQKTVECEPTAFNEWRKTTVEVSLNEGMNDLRLNNTEGIPMYIDQIIYTPADVEEEKFLVTIREAAHGQVMADRSEAAEGETVTLTVTPDENCQLVELRLVNSVYYTLAATIAFTPGEGNIVFTMPDDNVTIQPVFKNMASVYKLDFSDVTSGTIPKGWRCVQENNEVHEYPNSYGLGARTFAGFGGYQGKALYWREECAEYGRQASSPLTLQQGSYYLTFAMAAWKEAPKYKARIINASTGHVVATSEVFVAEPNANGSQSANLASATLHELPFTITESGNYVISFTNESRNGYFDEYLLLECTVDAATGIDAPSQDGRDADVACYDLLGRRIQTPQHNQVVILRSADGKSRKIVWK